MRVTRVMLVVNRPDYVKNEDEFMEHRDVAHTIIRKHLDAAKEDLDQAGFTVQEVDLDS